MTAKGQEAYGVRQEKGSEYVLLLDLFNLLKEMIKIANSSGDYFFQNEADFIINYYLPVYDNFGISNNSVAPLLDKAAQNARQGKNRKIIEVNFGGRSQKQKTASQTVSPIYWPIYVVYFIFAATKYVFSRLHKLKIPVFVILPGLFNLLFPRMFGVYNLLILRKLLALFQTVKQKTMQQKTQYSPQKNGR